MSVSLLVPPLCQEKPKFIQFTLAFPPKGHNKLCRTLLNQQGTKEVSSHFQKVKQAAGVFAQSAIKFYILLLTKMLTGTADKVILLISLSWFT